MITEKTDNLVIEIDVTAYVKLESRAKMEGMSVPEYISFFLSKVGTTNP